MMLDRKTVMLFIGQSATPDGLARSINTVQLENILRQIYTYATKLQSGLLLYLVTASDISSLAP